ncbi:MAG: tetratricopeptide repeat protein [Vicingaceae bacterium]|nr:tetratricopeptide repeat protein [Vicingaceae bacterium]
MKSAKIFFHLIFFLTFSLCTTFIKADDKTLDSLLQLERILPDDSTKIDVLNDIASIYLDSNYPKALNYATKSYSLAEQINYETGRITALMHKSYANDFMGRYAISQQQNYELLSIFEALNDSNSMSTCYNNIGIIHYYLGNYKESINIIEKALNYYLNHNLKMDIATCYNNLGNSFSDMGNNDTALTYYSKALDIYIELKDLGGMSLINGNVGEVHAVLKEYDEAYTSYFKSLQQAEKINDKWQQANMYSCLGSLLTEQNKHSEAISFLSQGLKIYTDLDAKPEMIEIYETTAKIYEQKNNLALANHSLKMAYQLKDEIFNKENANSVAEMNALYETKEKEAEILKQQEQAKYQATQKKMIIVGGSTGLILLIVIVVISVKGNITKKKVNETLEVQKKQIEMKNRDITDSIQYAKRIQSAILPTNNLIKKTLPENFVLYLPKDIVAGDFYWMEKNQNGILFAVADCTGHGVPGAMVSVVCNNALNRSVREFQLVEPAEILNKTRDIVIETFEKSEANIKDGMDIALCLLNNLELQYAGANNPLWIIRNNEIIETKGDKQPIGKYMNKMPFTNHTVNLQNGDTIYLLTDGFPDQFGGEKGKKYKYKPLKEKLLSINSLPLLEQKELLYKEFSEWKGELEQIDDVCLVGIRI